MVQRKEIRVMNIKDMNPVVNIGTEKSPLMVLDATIMVLKYEQATGKNYRQLLLQYNIMDVGLIFRF